MIFTSVLDDAFANILHDDREFVAADMRMGINQNGRVCAETDQLVQDLTYVTPFR